MCWLQKHCNKRAFNPQTPFHLDHSTINLKRIERERERCGGEKWEVRQVKNAGSFTLTFSLSACEKVAYHVSRLQTLHCALIVQYTDNTSSQSRSISPSFTHQKLILTVKLGPECLCEKPSSQISASLIKINAVHFIYTNLTILDQLFYTLPPLWFSVSHWSAF